MYITFTTISQGMKCLSIHFCNEIRRGFGNEGDYQLKDEFKDYHLDVRFNSFRENTRPESIVVDLVSNRIELLKQAGIDLSIDENSSSISESNQRMSSSSESESNQRMSLSSESNQRMSSSNDDLLTLRPENQLPRMNDSNSSGEDADLFDSSLQLGDRSRPPSHGDFLDELVNLSLNVSSAREQLSRRSASLDCAQGLSNFDRRRSKSLERRPNISKPDPPVVYKSLNNSKIAQAMWFCNNKRVKLDEEFKCYRLLDQNDAPFQVVLLPKAQCSCTEKLNCSHILAVQHLNGVRIADK
jgi:hypothetical protein